MSVVDVREAITDAHRKDWAPVLAAPARRFGDHDIAEEAAAEAFATVVERWHDAPDSPSLVAHAPSVKGTSAVDAWGDHDDDHAGVRKGSPRGRCLGHRIRRCRWSLVDWVDAADQR
ncbi:hypothetical protein ABN028_33285 [Actinopolymorpha sp. B17G11]|uniref:hypothetical protein n=1 Tax=Actinopolymorpha sp. B17G11 TaxID=3160861 RepID=UPI0032E3FF77